MIINNIALIVNNFIINLTEKNIPFYLILIGMFIFDYIVYMIIKLIKENNKIKF